MIDKSRSVRRKVFRDYVARYREAIHVTRYRDLPELQSPPFATLAYGGAGTAYVLWRLGERARARAWARAAADDRRALGSALTDNPGTSRSLLPQSFMFGRVGIHWVRAVVDDTNRASAIRRFVRGVRAATDMSEFAFGYAGHLNASVLLLAKQPDPQLDRLASTLAATLTSRARARPDQPWPAAAAIGSAHGWLGFFHALLNWFEFRREPLQPWFVALLRGLAAAPTPTAVDNPALLASWCNGFTGASLLWSKAFAATHDRVFLRAAQGLAKQAIGASGRLPNLCCGDAGIAYALFALDRVDPGEGWRERAEGLAANAIAHAGQTQWPNGLFHGHPGIVCLALDCLAENPGGFPAVDA